MKYSVWARDERIDFTSELTPEQALRTLESIEKPSEFAASLIKQCKLRGLSDRQRHWLIKLAQDEEDRRVAVAKGGTYKSVADLLNALPAARFQVRLDGFSLKKAGANSKNLGGVYLFEDEVYKGKITREGTLQGWSLSRKAMDQLNGFAESPIEYVIKHGKETGQCSCCGRPLSDPISVHGGIGPVCLERIAGKQARKIMQESFAASDNLIERLAKAGLLKMELKEEDGCLPPPERSEFQSEHDFQLANAIGNL